MPVDPFVQMDIFPLVSALMIGIEQKKKKEPLEHIY